ncbi:MAG: glycosyltransferase family 9 protein [bacterium]|nr:glycosyltransferase family 9 protein [bacterium]
MVDFKNILVIQTAFIGDAILASSLLEKLHASFPKATVSILVRLGNEGIYQEHPFLKEVVVWNKKEAKFSNLVKLISRIRKNKYDCVVNCHRFASSGLLTALSGARHTSGYKENPFSFLFNYTVRHTIGDGRHETERYNQLIEEFTDKTVFKPKLYPSTPDQKLVENLTKGSYICMAPASVWYTKQLPIAKWVELCDKQSNDLVIYLLGAQGDEDLCSSIKKQSSHPGIEILTGKLTLLQSAQLMSGSKMNFVNDSAPLHLASSMNSPVTAFFCSTVPEFGFGPLSDRSQVVEVKGLPCRPCGLHGYKNCPKGHFKCGHMIELPN